LPIRYSRILLYGSLVKFNKETNALKILVINFKKIEYKYTADVNLLSDNQNGRKFKVIYRI